MGGLSRKGVAQVGAKGKYDIKGEAMTCDGSVTRRAVLAGLLGVAVVGCDGDEAGDYQPAYANKAAVSGKAHRFSCPFHTPESLFRVYAPLVDHLNHELAGPRLKLEASRDYESFEQKLYYRNLDLAYCNPYQMLLAQANGYAIFAKSDDDEAYRGLIVTRADLPLGAPRDLAGQAVCYPAPSALASALLPQAFLRDNGIDVARDLDNRYVGTEESVLLNVYLGKATAGCTWTGGWRRFQREEPAKAAQLAVRWRTPSLPGSGFVARDDVAAELVAALRKLLVEMRGRDDGRRLLDHLMLPGFAAATAADYVEVAAFLRRFNDTVRPLALP